MASFTHCWKKIKLSESGTGRSLQFARRCLLWALLALPMLGLPAQAQTNVDWQDFKLERTENVLFLSTNVVFDLPKVLEDAMYKGVSLFFVTQADVMRDRWYFYDKTISRVERNSRLSYMPLTRRWRLNATAGAGGDSSQGQALSQSFETLAQAMAVVRQISQWKIGDLADSEPLAKLKVEFRFRLDLGQLPRPFQIGTIGQSEWDIQAVGRVPLRSEPAK